MNTEQPKGPKMSRDPIDEIFRISREIGALTSDQKNTRDRVDRLEREIRESLSDLTSGMKNQDEKLDLLLRSQASLKGGWKAVSIFAAILVSAGAVFSWLVDRWALIKGALF